MPAGLDLQKSAKLAKAIRPVLEEKFSSQTEAAQALGVKQGTLSDFLNGKKRAGPKLLEGILSVAPDVFDQVVRGIPVDRRVTSSDRYDDRARAIRAHELLGISAQDAEAAADSVGVALKEEHGEQPSARAWFFAINRVLVSGPPAGTPVGPEEEDEAAAKTRDRFRAKMKRRR